jgi:hypothetical protein
MRWALGMMVVLLAVLSVATRATRAQGADRAAESGVPGHVAVLMRETGDRSVGAADERRLGDMAALLEGRVRAAVGGSGTKVFRQAYVLTVPVVEVCRVTAGGAGEALPVFPLVPMGGQGASLGEPGAPAELEVVYGGAGRLEELKGREVRGRLVALEINASEGKVAWQRAASLGAAGILFLGDGTTENAAFLDKVTSVPLGVPRLYCDDAATVARVRDGGIAKVAAEVRVAWRERVAENIIAVLPAAGVGEHWAILQARYDGSSQVMGRAPGATDAVNAGVLVELAGVVAKAPAHCGVVCVWTAGDEWNLRGTREFMSLVSRGLRDPVQASALLRERTAAARQELAEAETVRDGVRTIATAASWPVGGANEAGRGAVEEELLRWASQVEQDLQRARLAKETEAVNRLKMAKQELLFAVALVGGKIDIAAAGNANGPEVARVITAAREVLPRWERDVARRGREVETLTNWAEIREAMPPRDPLLFLSLALYTGRESASPAGRAVGLTARSAYSEALDVTGRMASFAQAFRRYAEVLSNSIGRGARYVPESLENRFPLETFFPRARAYGSDAAIARGLPAVAVTTLYDRSAFYDTPNDRLENVDWAGVTAQAEVVRGLLLGGTPRGGAAVRGALTDPQLYSRTPLEGQVADQRVTLFERAIGETLPRLKAAEALIGGEPEIRRPLGPPLAGTRRADWYLTHADGTATFRSAGMSSVGAEVRLQAFAFDPAGRPRQALLANQSEVRGMVANFAPRENVPVRAMLFDCRRLDAVGLFDPRHFDLLEQLQVLDARRLDEAQAFNIYARDGLAAVFMPGEADIQWQLLASAGSVGNRMILINADEESPRGKGFSSTSLAEVGPLNWRTAQDFFWLDGRRKADLEKFGISNEVIRDLHAASEKQMAVAHEAEKRRDYPAFSGAADAVWSLQSQEYGNLIETSNGIIKGVIFLLLGVIPFSYFLERLLIGSPHVYRQIGWFAIIFVLMTAGLWFHPAFRISTAPMMILLAFLILILSSTVVYILFGKFEEEIARLRGTAGGGSGGGHVASFQRGAVLGAAIRLGLSNMRRRGTRTALTLITLVLLTFTLLCFTSVRESVQVTPRQVVWSGAAAGAPTPPAGILLRQRDWATLPGQVRELARSLALPPAVVLGDTAAAGDGAGGRGPVAARWWYASERAEQAWLLPVQPERPAGAGAAVANASTEGEAYLLSGLIGLEPAEAEFHGIEGGIDTLLPRFSTMSGKPGDGARALCWLPAKAQETLHLAVGDSVRIAGYTLRVAGFFDAAAFGQLRHLSGEPLSPTDASSAQRSGGGGGGAGGGRQANRESRYEFLDPISVAIVPGWMTEALGGRLTSVMVRPAGIPRVPSAVQAAEITSVATSLARRSAFGVYVSNGHPGGIQTINAAEASRPQDLGTVLVPMLIAGVIVLNTMLGAVAERTREIHVYTSVGLSPAHVGMLFLAEAAALGTLGVVFGYIIGQGLATVLSWTHLLPGVDLNYSSMSAIVTMGLVLGLVMLSALWPARSATRLAAPSLQRDWKLPKPVGDTLAVDLPFTVNETAARGVCAFLAEYLLSTSQAGTGRFTADNIEGVVQPTTQGDVRGLNARIWLAPYDLGVIQTMRLSIHPSDQPGVFDVHVRLEREAGNPGTWRRLNRPFLVEIRRQFLLWRSVEASRVAEYVAKSEALFGAGGAGAGSSGGGA